MFSVLAMQVGQHVYAHFVERIPEQGCCEQKHVRELEQSRRLEAPVLDSAAGLVSAPISEGSLLRMCDPCALPSQAESTCSYHS